MRRWDVNTEILIPVVGGKWDGADVLMKHISPGTVISLRSVKYEVSWKTRKPVLIPLREEL